MKENLRTIIFVAVAALVALLAWISRPSLREPTLDEMVGRILFSDFTDPLEAASLEIVDFDESTGEPRPFKVAQVDNQWSLPEPHHNYPADAKDRVAKAATSMMRLKVLSLESDSPGDHKEFGVLDPEGAKVGDTGVGTRVTMRDKNDGLLLSLIIGKKVPDQDDLRYVRETGKDAVYTVAVKTDELSTKFEDWIEKDLLKLNSLDFRRVTINDYSVDIVARPDSLFPVLTQIPRSLMTLEYDDKDSDSKWNLSEDKIFDPKEKQFVDMKMAEDEELNTTKLNAMKWALDDLRIVDVAPKPEGLSATLKATGDGRLTQKDVDSLQNRGFYLSRDGLASSEGEITVLMKDGVEYVLLFGQVAGRGPQAASPDDEDQDEEKEEEEEERSDDIGANRYLFVMARPRVDTIPEPELEELPDEKEPAEGEAAKSEASEDKPVEGKAAEGKAAEGSASEDEAADSAASENEPPDAEEAENESSPEEASEDESAGDDAADKKASEEDQPEAGEEKKDIKKERERIEKENKRKREQYEEKKQKCEDRVKELNERFADWYYVISNDVYKRIHLSREDVIKKKEKKEEEEEKEKEPEEEEEKEEADQVKEAEKAEPEKPEVTDKAEEAEKAGVADQEEGDQDKAAEDQAGPQKTEEGAAAVKPKENPLRAPKPKQQDPNEGEQ